MSDRILKSTAEILRELLAERDALLAEKRRMDLFEAKDIHVSYHDGKGWAAQVKSKWLDGYYDTARDAIDAAIKGGDE